jgi:hypothetical protein
MATDVGQPLSAMTMTRFGRDEATATIVGIGVVPETLPPAADTTPTEPDSDEPVASTPADTTVQVDPEDPSDTAHPVDPSLPTDPADPGDPADTTRPDQGAPDASESGATSSKPSEPADPSKPSEPADPSKPSETAKPSDPSDGTRPTEPDESRPDGGGDDPSETDEHGRTETVEESETLSTADRLKDVYGEAVSFCRSSVGLNGVVCVAIMGAAFVLLRKKRE